MTAERAQTLIQALDLRPHPEGGWYREFHRAAGPVTPSDGRGPRSALTSIDFLLAAGERSAWHRVRSDEAWHLLEGGPLRLWRMPPTLDRVDAVDLGPVDGPGRAPRAVVPADWWQAAEPAHGAAFAYVGATVGPGFEFADFGFGRDAPDLAAAIARLQPDLARLL